MPYSFRFGLRAPRVGRTAQRADPAVRRTAKAQPIHHPILWDSLSAYNSSSPAVSATSSVELQSAAWGGGELRDPKGSQKLGPKFGKKQRPIHSPLLGPARRENQLRFSRLKNKHSPKLAPVLRTVSASLRLRFRSAAFASPARLSYRRNYPYTGQAVPTGTRSEQPLHPIPPAIRTLSLWHALCNNDYRIAGERQNEKDFRPIRTDDSTVVYDLFCLFWVLAAQGKFR